MFIKPRVLAMARAPLWSLLVERVERLDKQKRARLE